MDQMNCTCGELKKRLPECQACRWKDICGLGCRAEAMAQGNGISIGGDSDTIAAITGSIAEAAYGIPDWIKEKAYSSCKSPAICGFRLP